MGGDDRPTISIALYQSNEPSIGRDTRTASGTPMPVPAAGALQLGLPLPWAPAASRGVKPRGCRPRGALPRRPYGKTRFNLRGA